MFSHIHISIFVGHVIPLFRCVIVAFASLIIISIKEKKKKWGTDVPMSRAWGLAFADTGFSAGHPLIFCPILCPLLDVWIFVEFLYSFFQSFIIFRQFRIEFVLRIFGSPQLQNVLVAVVLIDVEIIRFSDAMIPENILLFLGFLLLSSLSIYFTPFFVEVPDHGTSPNQPLDPFLSRSVNDCT